MNEGKSLFICLSTTADVSKPRWCLTSVFVYFQCLLSILRTDCSDSCDTALQQSEMLIRGHESLPGWWVPSHSHMQFWATAIVVAPLCCIQLCSLSSCPCRCFIIKKKRDKRDINQAKGWFFCFCRGGRFHLYSQRQISHRRDAATRNRGKIKGLCRWWSRRMFSDFFSNVNV